MQRQQVIGPSAASLRSFRAGAPGLPKLDDLESKLRGDNEYARYVCAVLSYWAYSDARTVSTIMARLGLERNRCLFFEITNNAALIRSTGYLVQSEDGKVALLCYRGTDPFDISTWAASGDANPATVVWPTVKAPAQPQASTVSQPQAASSEDTPNLLQRLVGAPFKLVSSAAQGLADGVGTVTQGLADGVGHVVDGAGKGAGAVGRFFGLGHAVDSLEDAGKLAHTVANVTRTLQQVAIDAHDFDLATPDEPLIKYDEARVHAGFYRNQRATWFEFARALRCALDGESILTDSESEPIQNLGPKGAEPSQVAIQPLERLYITGHSLGAAMGLLAAFRIASDPAYAKLHATLQHVYAFAPPRVGNLAFSESFKNELGNSVSCFVFKKDIVPRLPPNIPGTLDFQHVGKFWCVPETETKPADECSWREGTTPVRADSAGQLLLAFTAAFGEKLDFVQAFLSILRRKSVEQTVRSLYRGLIEERRYSFYDHLPEQYLTVSQLEGLKHSTELGGDA